MIRTATRKKTDSSNWARFRQTGHRQKLRQTGFRQTGHIPAEVAEVRGSGGKIRGNGPEAAEVF